MPTIYSSTNDGHIVKTSTADWTSARDATSGTAFDLIRFHSAITAAKAAGRGGSFIRVVVRSFFEFDTSGISIAPSSATLKIYGYNFNAADMIAVKSEQSTTLANTDFDAITGWVAGADNEGNVTKYSSEITTWSTSGYNDFTLTASALSDMSSLDTFKVCLIEYDYDLTNNEPANGVTVSSGCYFVDYTGTSRDPYVDYTAGVAITDNAIFFGANF